MIELTEQQRRELSAPEPVAIDPQTNESYVLSRQPVYERLKSLWALDDDDPDEAAADINEIIAEDEVHDPLLRATSSKGAGMNRGDVVLVNRD